MNNYMLKSVSRFIIVAFIFLLPYGAKAQCSGSFTYTLNGLTATFTGTTNPPALPGTFYYWWFSDQGNYATTQSPTYTFSGPGTYIVCFSYNDPNTSCSDSVCQTVVVGGGCTASFTSIDSLGYVFFFSSTTAGANAIYFWDFGDGNYSTTQNPSHVYAVPGTYTVCLTVLDSAQNFCDSVCYPVQASTTGLEENNLLQGSLTASPNPADGSLSLSYMTTGSGNATIKFFDASGRIAGLETVSVHGPGYNKTEINTSTLAQGIYLVKIEVDGTEAWTRIAVTHQSRR